MNIDEFEVGASVWAIRRGSIEKFTVTRDYHTNRKFLRNTDYGILDYWTQEVFPTAQVAIDRRRMIVEQSLREAQLVVDEWQKTLDELNAFEAKVAADA